MLFCSVSVENDIMFLIYEETLKNFQILNNLKKTLK